MNLLTLFGVRKNCLRSGWNIKKKYQFTEREVKLTILIITSFHFYELHTKFYRLPLLKVKFILDEFIGVHQCGFRCNKSTTAHIFYIRQKLEEKWEYNETV
jgi:hypothetical protein